MATADAPGMICMLAVTAHRISIHNGYAAAAKHKAQSYRRKRKQREYLLIMKFEFKSCARHGFRVTVMKRLMAAFAFVVMCHVASYAQIVGGFTTENDGHIYFQAGNNTYYTYQVTIVAVSSDRSNSEQKVIAPGNGFYLGPTTPWKWYWKQGDQISVVYPNGQSQTWICPQSDRVYSGNVSFRGKHCRGSVGCSCSGFSPDTSGKVWKESYCKKCGHHKKYHND